MQYAVYNVFTGQIIQWIDDSKYNVAEVPSNSIPVNALQFEKYQYYYEGIFSNNPPRGYYIDVNNNFTKYAIPPTGSNFPYLVCNYNDTIGYDSNGNLTVISQLQITINQYVTRLAIYINNFLNNSYMYSPSLKTFVNYGVRSYLILAGMPNLMKLNNVQTIPFKILDNTTINLNINQVEQLLMEMQSFTQFIISGYKWNLKKQMENATSIQQLETLQPNINNILNVSKWSSGNWNLNQYIVDDNNNLYVVINAGTTNNYEPVLNSNYLSITPDGLVSWKCLGQLSSWLKNNFSDKFDPSNF